MSPKGTSRPVRDFQFQILRLDTTLSRLIACYILWWKLPGCTNAITTQVHLVLWSRLGVKAAENRQKVDKKCPSWPHPTPYPTPYSKSFFRPHTVMNSIRPSPGTSGTREFIDMIFHQWISFYLSPCITSSTNLHPASDLISRIAEPIRPGGLKIWLF